MWQRNPLTLSVTVKTCVSRPLDKFSVVSSAGLVIAANDSGPVNAQ